MANNGMLMVGVHEDNMVAVRTPSAMTWGFQRVSNPDAGRTIKGIMHVEQVTTKIKLHLEWNGLGPHEAHNIASHFVHEYIYVKYWDILEDGFVTKQFYTGDWSAPFKVWSANDKRFASFSFDIIEV